VPTDDQIAVARRLLATHAHTLAEGAGATALAAVLNNDRFVGKQVAIICTAATPHPKNRPTSPTLRPTTP
jgi:threonine dehydratase